MRGCSNFALTALFLRVGAGSREPNSILQEVTDLVNHGYKEVTLLGQNNSYYWKDDNREISFANLIEDRLKYHLNYVFVLPRLTRKISPMIIHVVEITVICSYIHLPFQAGGNAMLKRMNRVYTREYYLERVATFEESFPIAVDVILLQTLW